VRCPPLPPSPTPICWGPCAAVCTDSGPPSTASPSPTAPTPRFFERMEVWALRPLMCAALHRGDVGGGSGGASSTPWWHGWRGLARPHICSVMVARLMSVGRALVPPMVRRQQLASTGAATSGVACVWMGGARRKPYFLANNGDAFVAPFSSLEVSVVAPPSPAGVEL
jgi:hypothetical protein